jgi:hypothetical protein
MGKLLQRLRGKTNIFKDRQRSLGSVAMVDETAASHETVEMAATPLLHEEGE